jgi:hypothetical protein
MTLPQSPFRPQEANDTGKSVMSLAFPIKRLLLIKITRALLLNDY